MPHSVAFFFIDAMVDRCYFLLLTTRRLLKSGQSSDSSTDDGGGTRHISEVSCSRTASSSPGWAITLCTAVADTVGGRTNFTMTHLGGNIYAYLYTSPLAGTYAARAFCIDGNGNSANTS